uniref:zinc-binding dehydrogenase n=1 Tax=Paenibacillus sp. FSL W7-1088 TaxID=2921695 RepID=UPI00403EF852
MMLKVRNALINTFNYKVGDHVIGSCFGSHAEYVCPRQNVLTFMPKNVDMDFLSQLMEDYKIKSFIEKCYPLEQIIEAHRHMESGRTKGKIVLKL